MIITSIPKLYRAHLYKNYPTQKNNVITIAWFGNACELVSDGETALFIDPFLTRNLGVMDAIANRHVLKADPKNFERWVAPLNEPIKAMLITQSHFDHILDAGEIGKRTGVMLVRSQSTPLPA